MKYIRWLFYVLLLVPLLARAETVLSIGVVPQFPKERISTDWVPVLNEVAKLSGVRLELKHYANIPAFEKAFLNGEMSVAYLNPYHAVMASKAQGYIPIIRDSHQRLTGILVVRKDSAMQNIAQLKGQKIAFPAPNAFGASLYMRALLAEAGVDFSADYRNTHSNVYRHVLTGRAAAGGGISHTLDKEPAEVRDNLRVLYETPPAYAHPIVVHPNVPVATRTAIQQAFLKLGTAAMLKEIQIPQPTKASYADYAPLEKLGLEKFVVLEDN